MQLDPHKDWCFKTVPQPQLADRVSFWPRGKVLGGSSVLNYMLAVRGDAHEYDEWETHFQCPGWGWRDVLPFFRALESFVGAPADRTVRGTSGPLYVAPPKEPLAGARAFVQAARELGWRTDYDYNAGASEGASLAQLTIKDGVRQHAGNVFLQAAVTPKLLVRTSAHVVSINLHETSNRAESVTFEARNGQRTTVRARHEVVLTAGAVQTPQLLMLSGIGPRAHLESLGIRCRVDSPGVGANLQDHLFAAVTCSHSRNIGLRDKDVGLLQLVRWLLRGSGPVASQGLEAMAFARVSPGRTSPDAQIHHVTVGGGEAKGSYDVAFRNLGMCICVCVFYSLLILPGFSADGLLPADQPEFQSHLMVTLLQPKSRGDIRLRSADPHDSPLIDPRYLTHPDDLRVLKATLHKARELIRAPAFQALGTEEIYSPLLAPGIAFPSAEYDEALLRHTLVTVYHPTGTCRMGDVRDPMTPCDPQGRVRGVPGLRVADLSLCPNIPSANTQLPAYMIGARIASFIVQAPSPRL